MWFVEMLKSLAALSPLSIKAVCLKTKRITMQSNLMNTCEEATPVKEQIKHAASILYTLGKGKIQ